MAQNLLVWAYVVAYITFAAGILSSAARFYSRALVVKSWGADDTASCAVVLVSIIHQVVLQLFLNLGCGKYVNNCNLWVFTKISLTSGRPGNLYCSFQSLDLLRVRYFTWKV